MGSIYYNQNLNDADEEVIVFYIFVWTYINIHRNTCADKNEMGGIYYNQNLNDTDEEVIVFYIFVWTFIFLHFLHYSLLPSVTQSFHLMLCARQ